MNAVKLTVEELDDMFEALKYMKELEICRFPVMVKTTLRKFGDSYSEPEYIEFRQKPIFNLRLDLKRCIPEARCWELVTKVELLADEDDFYRNRTGLVI